MVALISGLLLLAGSGAKIEAAEPAAGDVERGRVFFQAACAICHPASLGPGNTVVAGRGPSLVGVLGRPAGTGLGFGYSKALVDSKLVLDAATLDHFLENPVAAVPGTAMPIPVAQAEDRRNLIAYLSTLTVPAGVTLVAAAAPTVLAIAGDWHGDAPGVLHRVDIAALPKPFDTPSSSSQPRVVAKPENASLSVPPNFTINVFASGLSGPRLIRMAPNGDIFMAETRANRIRVLRAADGATSPSENQIFAEGLDRPFGIAFYPPGDSPQWVYAANNNSVVRFPYHSGELKASGSPEIIVPRLANTTGGHTTREVTFSPDGKRMFISVGSGSNIAENMGKKTADEVKAWEAENALGATWDSEFHRANILVTDPEAKQPLRPYATGIRNSVSTLIEKTTGALWTTTNERDNLGDYLVPDYLTRVKEGGYYGWPWYYMGNHEDPRLAGQRPDLAGQMTNPDVPFQAHSAPLGLVQSLATTGVSVFPEEYRGDIFVALHGSWNRSSRTGYKVVRARLDHGVPTGEYVDFLTGYVADDRSVWGRPVGVAVAHDGALLVTEDGNNTLLRISWQKAP